MKPIKTIDPIDADIAELEAIHQHVANTDKRLARLVKGDLLKLKAGHSAEKTAAHLLDKHHMDRNTSVILHDLRLELDGDVAQIDHLRINRFGFVWLYETKSFSTGLKIDDDGVCWRWDKYGKRYEEIPSPLLQSKRHEPTLRRALEMINYKALDFVHFVLVDYKASLKKPNRKEFDLVCRPDRLEEAEKKFLDRVSVRDVLLVGKVLGRMVSSEGYSEEDLQRFGRKLARLHKPAQWDRWARYGLTRPNTPEPAPEPVPVPDPAVVADAAPPVPDELLSSHKVAKQLGMTTQEFLDRVEAGGLAEQTDGVHQASERALKLGAENRVFRNKPYIAWPSGLVKRLIPQPNN